MNEGREQKEYGPSFHSAMQKIGERYERGDLTHSQINVISGIAEKRFATDQLRDLNAAAEK